MTENEAKKMPCPIWALISTLRDANKPSWEREPETCRGSKCPWWRWDTDSMSIPDPEQEVSLHVIKFIAVPKAEWKGYCGLAGKL